MANARGSVTDYITPIKDQLDEQMMKHCTLFVTIGSSKYESPRWYNFRYYDEDTEQLLIGSTQRMALCFIIDCKGLDMGFIDCGVFWPQFREYRTKFLQTNFKTIDIV